jgi:hypothetical protein
MTVALSKAEAEEDAILEALLRDLTMRNKRYQKQAEQRAAEVKILKLEEVSLAISEINKPVEVHIQGKYYTVSRQRELNIYNEIKGNRKRKTEGKLYDHYIVKYIICLEREGQEKARLMVKYDWENLFHSKEIAILEFVDFESKQPWVHLGRDQTTHILQLLNLVT